MKGVMRASMAQERRRGSDESFIPLREQLTQRWVVRRLGRIGHERRVNTICTTMFALARDLPRLTAAPRRLLRLSALLHDVGRKIDSRRHSGVVYKMMMEY